MQKLEQLRKEIEKIDAEMIQKLAQRLKLVKEIGLLKADTGIDVLDENREAQLMRRYRVLCKEHQLDSIFVQRLFEIIFSYSRSVQKWINHNDVV